MHLRFRRHHAQGGIHDVFEDMAAEAFGLCAKRHIVTVIAVSKLRHRQKGCRAQLAQVNSLFASISITAVRHTLIY